MNFTELANQAVNGESDPLKVYIELKKAEIELSEALDKVKDLAIDQADKYPGKTFKAFGAMIEKKSGGSKWDYSHIGAWNNAKKKLEYVQKIAQAGGGFDEETTEQIEKAVKIDGRSTIAVKLIADKDEVNS